MDILELMKVVFIGIVEGITEWLPISSTGHMFIAFVVSLLIIKFLMIYIKKHDFTMFGWYRIVLG